MDVQKQLTYQTIGFYTPHITIKIAHAFHPHSCVHAGLFVYIHISASPVFYTPVRIAHLLCVESWAFYIHTGFVGQCDETSIVYCILGYRVYRIIIIILIVTSNTSDSSAVGAGIKCIASTRYSNNLLLYTHNKKYSEEFSKKTCNSVLIVLYLCQFKRNTQNILEVTI